MMGMRRVSEAPAAARSIAEIRRASFLLAGVTGLDPRTCRKALVRGTSALLSVATRLLIEDAAKKLGIELPGGAP
jgi:hypothetical protein